MCLWFFMLCFVLVQKNIPTVEGRSPCSRRTGLDGARLTPGGLQAVLRFLAGQSLPTSQQAQGSVSSWRAWRPGEDSGQELGRSEQPSVPQLVFTVNRPKLPGTPGATSLAYQKPSPR